MMKSFCFVMRIYTGLLRAIKLTWLSLPAGADESSDSFHGNGGEYDSEAEGDANEDRLVESGISDEDRLVGSGISDEDGSQYNASLFENQAIVLSIDSQDNSANGEIADVFGDVCMEVDKHREGIQQEVNMQEEENAHEHVNEKEALEDKNDKDEDENGEEDEEYGEENDHGENEGAGDKDDEQDHQLPMRFDRSSFDDMENVPSWLPVFIFEEAFFTTCAAHNRAFTYFHYSTLDHIGTCLCSKCLKGKEATFAPCDVLLRVRRCMWMNSTENDELAKVFNTDGICRFTSNGLKVVFLRSPRMLEAEYQYTADARGKGKEKESAHSQGCMPYPALTSKGGASGSTSTIRACCITCRKKLKERSHEVVCCSIECKLWAVKLGTMPQELSTLATEEHKGVIMMYNLCREFGIEWKKGMMLKLMLKMADPNLSETPEGSRGRLMEASQQSASEMKESKSGGSDGRADEPGQDPTGGRK